MKTTDSSAYWCWANIVQRCCNPNNPAYPRYGGRGITIHPQWRKSFWAFLADMGDRPSKSHSIDRIDNSGNYEPVNCRWATPREQNRNSRRNIMLTYKGITLSRQDWAERLGVDSNSIRDRLRRGWTVEKTLSTPHRSAKERQRNTSRNRLITFKGQTKTLAEWAEITGMHPAALKCRINNWGVTLAFTIPYAKGRRGRIKLSR